VIGYKDEWRFVSARQNPTDIFHPCLSAQEKNERKMKVHPTMLLKTQDRAWVSGLDPAIFMKTSNLWMYPTML
jgi:hypothetical protein